MADPANVEHDRNVRAHDAGKSALEDGEREGKAINPPSGNDTNPRDAQLSGDGTEPAWKPSIFKRIWRKLDLDIPTVMMMFKLVSITPFPYVLI